MRRFAYRLVLAGVLGGACGGHTEFTDLSLGDRTLPEAGADSADPGSLCGNGVLDEGEECDSDDLGVETCASATMLARPAGQLSCTPECVVNPRGCRRDDGTGGSGDGGGGGSSGEGGSGFGGAAGQGGVLGTGGTGGAGGLLGGGTGGATGGGLFGGGGTTGGGPFGGLFGGGGTTGGGGPFSGFFGGTPAN
jgi:hypothetical protein